MVLLASLIDGGPFDLLAAALPVVPVLAAAALLLARQPAVTAVLAIVALASAASMIAAECRAPLLPSAAQPSLVVVTHNVGVRNVDPVRTAAVLLASDADLMLLQETDGTMAPLLERLRRRFPYGTRCPRPCSLAILSRWPTSRIRYRFRDAGGRAIGPAAVQGWVFRPGLPPFRAATLHLSHAGRGADREEQRAALIRTLRTQADRAMILAGDFNLTPWSAALRRLDADLAPLQRRTRGLASFPARVAGVPFPMPLLPIDHVYAGKRWGVLDVRRLPRTGSDHYAIRIELILQR